MRPVEEPTFTFVAVIFLVGVAFHSITFVPVVAGTKLVPEMVIMNALPPWRCFAGTIVAGFGGGDGTLIVKVSMPEEPPPGAGLDTVTLAVPAEAISACDTVAVSVVDET